MKINTPEFKIALKLIAAMEADNGGSFCASERQLKALTAGVARMQKAGCRFTTNRIELIAAGEQGEVERKMSPFSGYKAMNKALTGIFDHDDEYTDGNLIPGFVCALRTYGIHNAG